MVVQSFVGAYFRQALRNKVGAHFLFLSLSYLVWACGYRLSRSVYRSLEEKDAHSHTFLGAYMHMHMYRPPV